MYTDMNMDLWPSTKTGIQPNYLTSTHGILVQVFGEEQPQKRCKRWQDTT